MHVCRYIAGVDPELRLIYVDSQDDGSDPCLIVSNNERGFLPRDVLSISSIASSSKEGGKFIGQKVIDARTSYLDLRIEPLQSMHQMNSAINWTSRLPLLTSTAQMHRLVLVVLLR